MDSRSTLRVETPIRDEDPEWVEVEKLLRDPRLVRRLVDAITAPGSGCPLIGESANAVQLTLVLVGKLSAEVRGNTAAGKQALVDHVLTVWDPTRWQKVAGGSDKMLRYLPEDVKILYIVERRGMESGKSGREREETTLEYDVKLSMSEGTVEWVIVERNAETGKNTAVTHRRRVDSFVTTTTEITGPPEYENRIFILQVDDSEEANRRVRDSQLLAARSFSWEKRDWSHERRLSARALTHVMDFAPEPENVLVPYAEVLKDMLPTGNTTVRRNTPKLVKLIQASARLHFLQRERTPDGEGVIASPEDLALVLATSRRAFEAAQEGVTGKVRAVYDIAVKVDRDELPITSETVRLNAGERKSELGSRDTIYRCLKVLADIGVITPTGDKKGKFNVYELGDSLRIFGGVRVGEVLGKARVEYQAWARMRKPSVVVTPPSHSARPAIERTGEELGGTERDRLNSNGGQSEPLNLGLVGSVAQSTGMDTRPANPTSSDPHGEEEPWRGFLARWIKKNPAATRSPEGGGP